jgi:hypothetical protein
MSDMTETGTDRQPDAPREGGSGLWKWTKRILVGIVGLFVVVLVAGVIYQFVATKIDAYRWYPPPSEDDRRGQLQYAPPLHGRRRKYTYGRDG